MKLLGEFKAFIQRGNVIDLAVAVIIGAAFGKVVTSLVGDVLVFHLRSGLVLVLGAPSDIALKVAVAARVLQQLESGTRTVDVSVPSRPVTSFQSFSS